MWVSAGASTTWDCFPALELCNSAMNMTPHLLPGPMKPVKVLHCKNVGLQLPIEQQIVEQQSIMLLNYRTSGDGVCFSICVINSSNLYNLGSLFSIYKNKWKSHEVKRCPTE